MVVAGIARLRPLSTPPRRIAAIAESCARQRGAGRRWLAALPATPGTVRESPLGTLSEMRAPLADIRQADDQVIVRTFIGERRIRAERVPPEAQTTRIVTLTPMANGDVDRAVASRIASTIDSRLA